MIDHGTIYTVDCPKGCTDRRAEARWNNHRRWWAIQCQSVNDHQFTRSSLTGLQSAGPITTPGGLQQ